MGENRKAKNRRGEGSNPCVNENAVLEDGNIIPICIFIAQRIKRMPGDKQDEEMEDVEIKLGFRRYNYGVEPKREQEEEEGEHPTYFTVVPCESGELGHTDGTF